VKSRRPFSPHRTLVLHLLLVISLLLAQSAAYAHVSGHLKAPTDTSGLASGKASQLCGECLQGAPLLGAAGTPHVPSIVHVAAGFVPTAALICTPLAHRTHYAFRSRAPPQSL
jgi:hypothetical protein